MTESLNPEDHEFIPNAVRLAIKNVESPVKLSYTNPEIEKRWEDFCGEKRSRDDSARDGDLVLTGPGTWRTSLGILNVKAFHGKFKPWVTSRPAYTDSNGKRPGPVEGYNYYSVGTGGMLFVGERLNPKYLMLGSRHWREVGGEIDLPPAGFLKLDDLGAEDPLLAGYLRESREEVVEPDSLPRHAGVTKTDNWRNLTMCYEAFVGIGGIEKAFDLEEHEGGLVVLKRKAPKKSKYREEGLFMYPEGKLDSYVSDQSAKGRKFGERASLLLKYHLGI